MVSRQPLDGPQDEHEEEVFGPDDVVSLTPHGRAMWFQLFEWCSDVAGRPIEPEELSLIFKKVQADVGSAEPNYRDPKVMECFRKHLRRRSSS